MGNDGRGEGVAAVLTEREIRTARVPEGRNQLDLRDSQVRGLVLRVYRSGARTWFLTYRRKEDNRRRWMKLAPFPGLSLKDARTRAGIELGRIAGGEDPLAERQQVRQRGTGETVAELAAAYLAEYAIHKRPASYQMDRWQLDTYVLPRWGGRPATDITKQDVRELLEALAAGTIAANGKPTKTAPRSLRALLSKMFDWAAEQGVLAGNPAAGVKLPVAVREHLKQGGRDRVLSDEEICTLWEELDRMDEDVRVAPVTAAAFRLILLTAQRPGEVMTMRWCDIEDGAWWVVPAEVAKNGEANRVYLSPQAREVLGGLQAVTGSGEWVLDSPRKPGFPLRAVKTAQAAILRRSGMRHWTPHDLRRTAASKMRALGVTRRVVQAILNHKDRSVTAVYDRYGLDPEKRDALTAWGRRVEEIVVGVPGDRVAARRRLAESPGSAEPIAVGEIHLRRSLRPAS